MFSMNLYIILLYGVCIMLPLAFTARFKVPEVRIEALSPKGFRVSIPHVEGIVLFAFHGNLNKDIEELEGGEFSVDINEEENGRWTYANRVRRLKVGDVINYWVYVDYFDGVRKLGYMREGETFVVTELINNANPLLPTTCAVASSTTVNGKNACVGDIIFQDFFNNTYIDLSKWLVEHKIPTYLGPDFVFNSYQNIEGTRFIKNNVLHLQPIALKEESDVRGILNLRDGCTSQQDMECFYQQASAFLLPPVKSAKMTSLTKFKYGRIDIQAKLPAGDWIVPIIQLQPIDNNTDFSKIWITYSRGNNHLTRNLNDDIGSRILFAGPVLRNVEPERSRHLVSRRSNDPYYNNFHLYTLEWLPSGMKFYFNSQKFGEISSSSFNSELQLSLGVSVGGLTDFPDGYNSDTGTKPWLNTERNFIKSFFDARNAWLPTWNADDTALKIDSVKITAI